MWRSEDAYPLFFFLFFVFFFKTGLELTKQAGAAGRPSRDQPASAFVFIASGHGTHVLLPARQIPYQLSHFSSPDLDSIPEHSMHASSKPVPTPTSPSLSEISLT